MRLDHLVLAISDLDDGIAQLKKLTGVEAIKGGRHPDLGTENAIAALGDRSYIELLAPDADTGARPKAASARETPLTRLVGRAFGASHEKLTLVAWAVAARRMEELDVRFRAHGYVTTGVHDGSRVREDGKRLAWQMLAVTAPDDPLLPFWIDWAPDSDHPSPGRAERLPARQALCLRPRSRAGDELPRATRSRSRRREGGHTGRHRSNQDQEKHGRVPFLAVPG